VLCGRLAVAAGSTFTAELDLRAVQRFPTLRLDAPALHFGAVLAGAPARAHATLTNPGELPTSYAWALAEVVGPTPGAPVTISSPAPPHRQLIPQNWATLPALVYSTTNRSHT
jgi:hypothetical protein